MSAAESTTATEFDPKLFKTQHEVARWLRTSVATVISEVRAGHLKPVYVGRKPIYPVAELRRFVEAKMAEDNPRRHGSMAGRRNARREAARNGTQDQGTGIGTGSVNAGSGNAETETRDQTGIRQ